MITKEEKRQGLDKAIEDNVKELCDKEEEIHKLEVEIRGIRGKIDTLKQDKDSIAKHIRALIDIKNEL